MKKYTDAVALFHDTFKVEQADSPTLVPENDFLLRHKLMNEENQEYLEACATNDLVEVADALGDQLYILCGTILKHGLQHKIEEVFDEIQKSNMSKLDDKGQPIFRADGKILKGTNYFQPDIKTILDV
jgi:predicted HAD superfamily Cof-like phosphohydrolase